MGTYHTDQANALRTLLRDTHLEPHPREEPWAYAAHLVHEQQCERRSHRLWGITRVGIALSLAALGITLF